MADVPRDPRQLARDILAGKISIEELAREQQRRRGGAGVPGSVPQARVPARVPLPRTLPPQQRTVIRQPPARQGMPPPRPAPVPPQRTVQQRPRAVITAPPAPPRRPEVRPITSPVSEMPSGVQRAAESPASIAGRAARADQALNIHGLAASRTALRQGILLAEILGKPVALREEESRQ